MATMLEVDKKSPIRWLPTFYQRRGVVIFTDKSLFFKTKPQRSGPGNFSPEWANWTQILVLILIFADH
jgi:hypothetical protein